MMQRKPYILITNDDGVHARGIRHLWQALSEFANVTVVAPASEQSATGLSITIRSPLRIEEIQWPKGEQIWSVTGTPADCVKLGLNVICKEQPDLILSGINRGSNAGRNILYSGTVAGAIEGVMHNIPSIAFSCSDYTETDYASVEKYIVPITHHVLEHPLPRGTLLNVNFPLKGSWPIKGIKLTRHGLEYWAEKPNMREHPDEGHSYYWLGLQKREFEEHDDCDISWLKKGYATAVPVHVAQMTDHAHLNTHQEHFNTKFQHQ